MALTNFTPTTHPDFGMARTRKPKVLKPAFGDGYSQRAADGQNNTPISLTATWTNLPKVERDYLLTFFDARGAVEAFLYTYVDETVAKAYVCEEWTDTHEDGATYSVEAKFVQVYDIA